MDRVTHDATGPCDRRQGARAETPSDLLQRGEEIGVCVWEYQFKALAQAFQPELDTRISRTATAAMQKVLLTTKPFENL